MTIKVLHQRSATKDAAPAAAGLAVGAIAINYNHQSPALIIKDDTGALIHFNPNAALGETEWACSDRASPLKVGVVMSDHWIGNKTITGAWATVETAPVGSTLKVTILKGAAPVVGELDIAAGALTSTGGAPSATVTLADKDLFTINVTQIGATTAGAGLKVYIMWRRN